MSHKVSIWAFAGFLGCLWGCGEAGDTECGAKVSFSHDLSSIFDDDCNFDSCMGDNGSDFKIMMAPVVQTIAENTCPGGQNGQGSETATVERAGDVLTITVGFQELAIPLSDNSLSSGGLEFGDAACQNNLSNIQGGLDYETKTLVWSYDLRVTNLGGCF
ncbi:MAG: hypothetical protein HOK97_15810 [Deltaproteobacteria bacterium]|jgi:hypothetical protein|nr:hypothetical protein [Deltaproteobacteria bacterium]MBT6491237.1 hypothetical protein [Deltaproteobacteria bacterium]